VDAGEPVAGDLQAGHRAGDHADPARGELPGLVEGQRRRGVPEQHDGAGELPEEQGLVYRRFAARQHADDLVAYLPPVAVRAVHHVAPPALAQPGYVRQLVDHAGRDHQPARDHRAALDVHLEAGSNGGDLPVDEPPAVSGHLRPAGRDEVARRHAVARQEPVHARSRRVARLAAVDHDHRAPGPDQHERGAQPGGTPADHRYVVCHGHHGARPSQRSASIVAVMANDSDVLATVGPRLRALRERRNLTLGDLSEQTGISVSTLSRLESGGRRPTLELLLPLARAHQVQLDELVDAPPTGDPRVHMRPMQRNGMTYIPLSRYAGGLQAVKMIIPVGRPILEPKSHEGYDWMYVLDGRLRLVLGDQDLVLTAGEAAEFDTRVPHAFTNAGRTPAELLCLFGPQGERAHLRARTVPAAAS
jgi:transcriptional regulator with XRE-family HTH domain